MDLLVSSVDCAGAEDTSRANDTASSEAGRRANVESFMVSWTEMIKLFRARLHAASWPQPTMESFEYPQFDVQTSIALFTVVENAAQLRARIVQAATLTGTDGDLEREAVNFAFVDARLVSLFSVKFRPASNYW